MGDGARKREELGFEVGEKRGESKFKWESIIEFLHFDEILSFPVLQSSRVFQIFPPSSLFDSQWVGFGSSM